MDWLKEILKKAGIEEEKLEGLIGEIGKDASKVLHSKG